MRHFVTVVILATLFGGELSAQTILYQERCTDGSLDNAWFAGFNGNTLEAVSYPGNPSGDGWVGRLGNHFSGGNVGASWSGSMEWQDFYYEAQVYVPIGEGVYHGIEFRVDSTGLTSGYQFVARFTPGGMVTPRLRFRIRPKDNPGMPGTLRDWEGADISGGIPTESGWHKMAVLAKDHRFWFWFDGEELPGCPVTDFSTLNGGIGAYLWDSSSPMISLHIDDINVSTDVLTGADDIAELPQGPVLHQNYPQPVRAGTNIMFDLPERMYARLEVFSIQGSRLAVIREGMLEAGRHTAAWNASAQPAGMYMLRLTTRAGVQERRMVVLR